MRYLFSPWRMKYIRRNTEHVDGCIFCLYPQEDQDEKNLIVYRGKLAFVILNRYPYTSGHLMVVPYVHQPNFEVLDTETRSEIMELMTYSIQVLRRVYSPGGFNVGANIGTAAGAGIAPHVHFHIVPRWVGDTNFMSAAGNTRVLPEMLGDTYRRIRKSWDKSGSASAQDDLDKDDE